MRLQAFNGGKNTRLAQHLIGVNEGIVVSNVNIEDGTLTPVKKKSTSVLSLNEFAHYFSANDEWVGFNINRDYVEYQERLYWTQDSSIPQVYTGTTTYNLGIAVPINTPAIPSTASGVLTGTYQYVYTFYNSTTGYESGPSPLSVEVVASSNSITIDNMQVSTETGVNQKRIYRVGGLLTNFSLVVTVDNTLTTYVDNIADTAIPGDILATTTYAQAPNGLKYLTEAYGIMFGALGDKVYYTPIGVPWAWPALQFFDLPTTVTGIGIISAGILLFTRDKTFIITGNTPETFSKYPLDPNQGCTDHKSIAYNKSSILWASTDGICTSTGGPATVLTKVKLGKQNFSVKKAVVYSEVYYLQLTDGTIFVVDFRYGGQVYDLSLTTTNLVAGNDKLYGYDNNGYYELFQDSTVETLQYTSPKYLNGAYTERKNYKSFYIRSEGALTVKVYIDDTLVATKVLSTTDTHELKVPQVEKNAYSVYFEISGTGTVYEIDWLPGGRETT